MNVAFYPGCSHHGLAQEYDHTSRLICSHLAVNLTEVEDWNCCGATAAHSLDHDLSLALNVRNLAQVKRGGHDSVVTPCSGCFSRLKTAAHEIRHDPDRLAEISRKLECPLPENVEVRHLLQLIVEEYSLDRIRALVKKPLCGLKAAAYYGCLLTRPAAVTRFDDPEQPRSMDNLLQALGAEPVTWSYKAECCGGGFNASEPVIALELGQAILDSAKNAGAEAIIAACPLCQMNLDGRQGEMTPPFGGKYDIPVVYFTQLMGLAFGYAWRELRFKKLIVNPRKLLEKYCLL
ncbi:MAG: CoB--CoM heterodisulfide reductase iron-sulfur subunit B family protein [Desulfovibrio sp.]|jgi:heterodisulfide reductase subunit B|nr:CoB--CoM heterodisulfide reductase iron-sulfur subunit B family protein [Desulfovibrio sp.]